MHVETRAIAAAALAALLAACAATSNQADGGAPRGDVGRADGPSGACALPRRADGLVLARSGPSLPGPVTRAAAGPAGAVACGDGFVALVPASGAPKVRSDKRLAGFCDGVAVDAAGRRAAVVTRAGRLALVSLAGGGAPTVAASATRAGAVFHDVVFDGDRLWVAAGKAGVLGYRISGGTLVAAAPLAGAKDARGLALGPAGTLLVADGAVPGTPANPRAGGGEIRLLSTAGKGVLSAVTGLEGTATRALVSGTRGVILRPGLGFDVLDLGGGKIGARYAVKQEDGFPLDAALDGDTLLLAAGSHLQRYRLGRTRAILVAADPRPDRGKLTGAYLRAVAAAGGGRYLAFAGARALSVTLGPDAPAPEIDGEETTFSLLGTQSEALMRVRNTGSADLIVTGAKGDPPFAAEIAKDLASPRPGCPSQFVVKPGGNILVWVRRKSGRGLALGKVHVFSDDADERDFAVRVEASRPPASVGDAVDDFDLLVIDGTKVRLSAQKKKVVLAKLYNPV